jgi:hypothetical protein
VALAAGCAALFVFSLAANLRWNGNTSGYLIIDALDAAREG